MTYISFKDAKKLGLVVAGAKVVSYPDHKQNSLNGKIIDIVDGVDGRNEIMVSYKGYGRCVLKLNGKLMSTNIDTNLDINLIEIE